jgi:outer membrane receptor protein involved in Fe transport
LEYELGIIKDYGPLSARAAVFYYDIKDFINDNGITAPGSGLGSNCLYNTDNVRLYGGELELSLKLGDRFRATAAYLYQENSVSDTAYDTNFTYYLPDLLPRHKIKLLGQYQVWDNGWLIASARYVGKREAQKDETLGDYATLDVGFEQDMTIGGLLYNLKLSCNNITGTDYQEQAGYSMPSQVYAVEMGLKF